MARSEEELKSLLKTVKEEREKAWNTTLKILRSWHLVPWLHGKYKGEKWKQWQILFFWAAKITTGSDCSHEVKRCLCLGGKTMTNLDSILKSRDIILPYSQSYGFSSNWVRMWELDHKEGWAPKNWWFQIVVLVTPLDSKEIKPVNPERNQPWIFIGRTAAQAETLIFWPPDAKSWLIGKYSDAGKDWR